ncbi:hypothetical protein BT93_K1130 [Corymbia citriodora subsp. variegata]|nr:hypothetical protein BT93_K1130 [Corymbia citriodora subsp. variegata]
MKSAPSLVSLSLAALESELLRGDDVLPHVYELPADLFDALVARLPPLGLHKLQNEMPKWKRDEYDADDCFKDGRKRARNGSFNDAWRSLYKRRWAEIFDRAQPADWQQAYWEIHLQKCMDEAAEVALLPSFNGKLGEIRISDAMLEFLGYEGQTDTTMPKFSKLHQHCECFGHYLRHLYSLRFCEAHLDRRFAGLVFTTLLDTSSNLSILDLSDNEIAGWLSSFTWKYRGSVISPIGAGKSLASLCVLNLRGNNLHKEDAKNLRHALVYMPALRTLDLSDNCIEDDGLRHLIPFLVEASGKGFPLADLSLENCELSSDGVIEFLSALSTLEKQLSSLSISDNGLGSHVAEALVKLLDTSVQILNISGVGLDSSGFQELQKVSSKSLKLVKIDISKNRGGIESAKFLSKLMECAPQLVAVNAAFNLMPPESLTIIYSALKGLKGNLGLLDLRGNNLDKLANDASMLVDLQGDGRLHIVFESSPTLDAPYDDDP